jgi:hypothetical protein
MVVEKANLERREIPTSYVPFRNAHFLSIAVSWGEVLGARKIFVGAVAEDSSGYPDCRPEYYQAFESVIAAGTKPETQLAIVTPVIHMRKSEIVRRGVELGAPFELTWSCYQAEDVACGVCDSCALRLRAFEEAGVRDPISYAVRPSYRPKSAGQKERERILIGATLGPKVLPAGGNYVVSLFAEGGGSSRRSGSDRRRGASHGANRGSRRQGHC